MGRYRLDRRLGEGAVGVVYRAEANNGGVFALKLLKPALVNNAVHIERFRREVRIATLVQHRHVVRVVEAGEIDGVHYLASEFWEDGSLADLLAGDGLISPGECARLGNQIAAGLDGLHDLGVVHRDVKPGNVLLGRGGRAAVADFGLAKGQAFTVLTQAGHVLGTLDYIAPEVIEGRDATKESDIYSFGCLLYECITGTPPFGDRSVFEVAVAHLEEKPPDPRELRGEIGAELAWTLLQALAKDPAKRPPSSTALARLVTVAIHNQELTL